MNPWIFISIILAIAASLLMYWAIMLKRKVHRYEQDLITYENTVERQGTKISEKEQQLKSITSNVEALIDEELRDIKYGQAHLLAAIKIASLGFWEWDMRTNDMGFNHEFYDMLGYDPGGMEAKTHTFVDFIHPDEQQHVMAHMHACIQKHENIELQFRMRSRDGSFKWMLCRAKIGEFNSRNEAAVVYGVLLDITKIHEQEEKIVYQAMQISRSLEGLKKAHKELQENSDKMREYSYYMSHNIRKPLANLLGLLRMDLDGDLALDPHIGLELAEEMDELIQKMYEVLGKESSLEEIKRLVDEAKSQTFKRVN